MNTRTDLSFDRTPPFTVPLYFMLATPLFGIATGLALLWGGEAALASRWMPATLGATHLVTLGMLAMTMFGAMQQMLPVLAGMDVPATRHTSRLVFIALSPGILLFALGLSISSPLAIRMGLALIATASGLFLLGAGSALVRSPVHSPTIVAMRFALLSFVIALASGLYLATAHAELGPALARHVTDLHAAWALVGWVGMLVIGVSYQVVPMFQLTPDYGVRLTRMLTPSIFALLVIFSIAILYGARPWAAALRVAAEGGLAVALCLFALSTLRLQGRRKRKVPDITLTFFRTGMLALLACAALWLGLRFAPTGIWMPRLEIALGALYLGGFALSVVNGMLYKIIPFLAWLHLTREQQRLRAGRYRVPNMKNYIPERFMRIQLHLHHATLTAGAIALILPAALPLAGLLLAGSSGLLTFNLWRAAWRYRCTLKEILVAAAP